MRAIWLVAVGLSAAFLAVLWLALSVERMGLSVTVGFVSAALIYRWRVRP